MHEIGSQPTAFRPVYPVDPDAERVDPRFPPSMNALIAQMSPAERNDFAAIYAPIAPLDALAERRAKAFEEAYDRQAYDEYLNQPETALGPTALTFEQFVANRDRQQEDARLANFREMTGNPHATLEEMYAAGDTHRQDLIQEHLELLQETDPGATLVDVGRQQLEERTNLSGPAHGDSSVTQSTPGPL